MQTATTGSLSLDDGGDTVTLKDASGTVIKTVTYGTEAGDNQSIARSPDFTGDFVKHTTITTNAVRFSPGKGNTDGNVLAFIKNVNHFVTTWNTEADDAGNTSITLPIVTGAYDVDTNNDGTFDKLNLTGPQTFDLGSAGIHTIAVRPNSTNTKNELQIQFAGGSNPGKLTTIENWGTIVWTSMNKAFEGCTRIRIPSFAGTPNLSKVTSMTEMFKGATGLTGNLNAWDVSNVISMNSMFSGVAIFTNDLNTWNVAKVTNMSSMFYNASNFNGDISTWNVSNVTNMRRMFRETSNFNNNINGWNVMNVTNMNEMFQDASGFNGNLSAWNVTGVTDMSFMFDGASNFNGNISTWNVAKVTRMNSMFSHASDFNSDISAWNVSKVTDFQFIFNSATSFNGNLSAWNVAKATNMNFMFSNASDFNGDISTWNVAKVTNMHSMFSGATSFSKQNYEKLLSEWSKLTLQNGVIFLAPPVSYCFGKTARNILTHTYRWRIAGDSLDSDCLDLSIAADALLQGPYNSTATLMNDDLRTADRIPLTSPYNDGATVTDTGIFDNADDDDDIVDWVQIELRNSSDITEVLTTASALIQRDGDIVAPDGTSDVTISGTGGDYYVSVNHRNHIAASTVAALTLSTTVTAIDFTVVANVTGGTNAMAEVSTGKYALFAGDADGNNQVQTGDYNVAATRIGQSGYFGSDTDMNGEVQITDLNLFIARAIGNGIQF